MEHTNLPARMITREHHNMNLPAHIITCSPPTMNLPAHDIVNHVLVQAQHHKHPKHNPIEHTTLYAIAWRYLSTAKRHSSAHRLVEPFRRQASDTNRATILMVIA